jgi:GDP-L-fucose synthase
MKNLNRLIRIKKILVTGGSGLIGSAIQKISCNYKHFEFIFISSKNCDLKDFNSTLNYFNLIKPDFVIHLAANVGGLFKNMNQKVSMFEDNILINMNVLRASHLTNVEKLVCCLSTCIFPDKTTYPINETMLHNGPPHHSNDAYAYAKRMLEVQCKCYQEQFDKDFICIIPTNIYGPHDNFHLNDSHVIPGLIHKCYLAKMNNEPFVISGSGSALRQFIHSEDLASLILWTLFNYDKRESLILSVPPEHETSIKKIAEIIADKFDYSHNLQFDTSKSDGQLKKTADNSKLMSMIKNFDFIPIEKGLEDTIKWFIDNYDNIRK